MIMVFVNFGGGGYWFFKHSKWNGRLLVVYSIENITLMKKPIEITTNLMCGLYNCGYKCWFG